MTRALRPRGRPLGVVSLAALDAMRLRPLSRRGLAALLQLSYREAHQVVSHLQRGGHIAGAGSVPTATKSATLYAPADALPQPQARSAGADLHFVMGMMIRSGGGK